MKEEYNANTSITQSLALWDSKMFISFHDRVEPCTILSNTNRGLKCHFSSLLVTIISCYMLIFLCIIIKNFNVIYCRGLNYHFLDSCFLIIVPSNLCSQDRVMKLSFRAMILEKTFLCTLWIRSSIGS